MIAPQAMTSIDWQMSCIGVRRVKAAFLSGCESHPAMLLQPEAIGAVIHHRQQFAASAPTSITGRRNAYRVTGCKGYSEGDWLSSFFTSPPRETWKPDILTSNLMAGLPIRTFTSYYLTSPIGGYFLSFATER